MCHFIIRSISHPRIPRKNRRRLAGDLGDGRLQAHHRGGQVRLGTFEALLVVFALRHAGLKNGQDGQVIEVFQQKEGRC